MSAEFDSGTKLRDMFKPIIAEFDMTIEELDLSVRTYNWLQRAGINTLQQILSMSEDDLMKICKHSHAEIMEKLRIISGNLEQSSYDEIIATMKRTRMSSNSNKSIDFDSSTKLGDVFKSLIGLDLPVEELDLSVRVYNFLKRSGIHNLQQILSLSEDELINIDKRVDRRCHAQIIDRLRALSDSIE